MGTYAVIEIGGEQLRVEPGRFYDVRHFASLKSKESDPNTKISIHRVLLVRHKFVTNSGHPWLESAIVRGRILQPCRGEKITIFRMHSKKKMRRKLGYGQNLVRFVVDSICLDGEKFYQ
uniref:Large ribosomal subunit protein bL21c n=1 Tax=Helminthostachys zeylanica TaxID=41913 RepID=A0A1C6ZVW7_HELZY|nr:ribosomal protein L21 [Helminthostachys zeylanica]